MTTTTDNNQGTKKQDDLKKQASKIIASILGHTEHFVHSVIDEGSNLAGSAEEKIRKAYDGIKDLLSKLDEKDPSNLKFGDLVISPVDINDQIKAGEVFEYNKDTAPLVKSETLLVPDQQSLVKYGRIQELKSIKRAFDIMPSLDKTSLMFALEKRIQDLNAQ